jgi:hypothetical protein
MVHSNTHVSNVVRSTATKAHCDVISKYILRESVTNVHYAIIAVIKLETCECIFEHIAQIVHMNVVYAEVHLSTSILQYDI